MGFARILAWLAAWSLAALATAAAQPVTLRLDWTALGYHAPFYYGLAKGFYRDAGLDLRIFEGKGSPMAAMLVGNGSNDFAFADASTTAQLITKGLPAKVVMGIFRRSTLAVFYPRGKGIGRPADLKGKRIVACPADQATLYLPFFLAHYGMSIADVDLTTVDCGIKYSYIGRGRADAIVSYVPAAIGLLQNVGFTDIGHFDFSDAGLILPAHGIIASDEALRGRPDVVRRFLAATARSWQEAEKSPDAAVTAEVAANPLMHGKEAQLKAALTSGFAYIAVPSGRGRPFGWQSPDDWKQTIAILAGMRRMDRSVRPETIVTNSAIASR